MLKSHGWDVKPNGVSTCASPGTGPNECGAGIKAGAKLEFNLNYASGVRYRSARKCRGSSPTSPRPGSTSTWRQHRSTRSSPNRRPATSCSWEMSNWGGGWLFGVNPYPTGDQIFGTGSGSNFSNYSSATADKLIDQTVHGTASLAAYEDYLANQIPVLWMPHAAYQVIRGQHQAARGHSREPDPGASTLRTGRSRSRPAAVPGKCHHKQ